MAKSEDAAETPTPMEKAREKLIKLLNYKILKILYQILNKFDYALRELDNALRELDNALRELDNALRELDNALPEFDNALRELDKARRILFKEKNAREFETIEEVIRIVILFKEILLFKEKNAREFETIEEVTRIVILFKEILLKKMNARAIKIIEKAIRIVYSLRELKEFKCPMSGEIIGDPVVVASWQAIIIVQIQEGIKKIDGQVADGAQQHHQESEFGEAFGRMTDSIYRRPTIEDTFLFELIGNYIELRDRIRLRAVCRVWNEVVSQKEVYGMFVQTGNLISFLSLKNYFSIFSDPLGFIHDKQFEGGDMVLVSSCQGILCFRTTSGYIISNHHSEYLALPTQTINHGKKKVVAILCHELGDGDFKLAIAFATESLNLAYEVYAEGSWFTIVSSIKGPHLLYLRRDGLYHNGSVYFLSEWGCIFKFDLATRVSFLLRHNALRSDILGVFQNRVCTFRFDRVAAGCELVVASVEENVVQCSLELDWASLKLSPSGCRILACTKDHNIIIAIGTKVFWYKIHSRVLEPIRSLPEHDKANFVAYSCYDVNEILRF